MHDTAPGEMHYIAVDLDSREWVEAGFARLDGYLACWRLFGELYPRDDLDSLHADVDDRHGEIEEWAFRGGRSFFAVGRFDDDSNPFTGFGWMHRLVDARVLRAGRFKRIRKPLLLLWARRAARARIA
jgi:hypothetical protein